MADSVNKLADHVLGDYRVSIRLIVGITLGNEKSCPFRFLNLNHPVHHGNLFRSSELDNVTYLDAISGHLGDDNNITGIHHWSHAAAGNQRWVKGEKPDGKPDYHHGEDTGDNPANGESFPGFPPGFAVACLGGVEAIYRHHPYNRRYRPDKPLECPGQVGEDGGEPPEGLQYAAVGVVNQRNGTLFKPNTLA